MAKKRGKKYLEALKKYDPKSAYGIDEALEILKKIKYENFDSTVELDVNLGVDPRHQDQMIRGTITLPNGTGKEVKVLVLTTPDMEEAAKNAGADHVGLDEYLEKIGEGWTDVDVIIATQNVMPKVAKYGRILGPKKLMPSPKSGTVVPPKAETLAQVVKEFKGGKVNFRVDKYGIVHLGVGKSSFPTEKLKENIQEVMNTLQAMKPDSVKGNYIGEIHVATTMSPGVKINKSSLVNTK